MIKDTNSWIREFERKGALWIHDGNPKRPHALLTSGKHSDGFFNSGLVLENPFLLNEACADLVSCLKEVSGNIDQIDRVVGPAMGAITLADGVGREVNWKKAGGPYINQCLSAFTEKEGDGPNKVMAFKRFAIRPGERLLPVEDVLTTGGSVLLTTTAITNAGGIVVPFICVLVNRSGLKEIDGNRIVALIDRPMPMWTEDECPLCRQGSEAIRPKGTENWMRLKADY